MTSTRLLELIKQPDTLEEKDLSLIRKEIGKFPYAQHLHALNLLGTHRFDKDSYPEVLSMTAAFTTDKKILYNLLNPESQAQELENSVENQNCEGIASAQTPAQSAPESVPRENRLLFSGESIEDGALGTEVIDYQATEEAGTLVINSIPANADCLQVPKSKDSSSNEVAAQVPPVVSRQLGVAEEVIQPLDNSAELSFASVEEFLPQIQITTNESVTTEVPSNQQLNRHELEMKALVAKVEQELLAKKKLKQEDSRSTVESQEEAPNDSTDFIQIDPFNAGQNSLSQNKFPKETDQNDASTATTVDVGSEWKPLSLDLPIPDGAQTLKGQEPVPAKAQRQTLESSVSEHGMEDEVARTPLTDNSLHSSNENSTIKNSQSSNVVEFIATWQNWLKIDRIAGNQQEPPAELPIAKNSAIDKFIENQPRISKLKEDRDYVVREKEGDISHLMTETLAGLYIEQRLYNKAIQAFEILIKKNPDQKEKYREKIKEIKLLKNPNR